MVGQEEDNGHGDQLVLPPDSIRLPRSRTGRALLTGLPASHGDLLAACASVWRCALDLGLDLGPEAWEDTALALSRGGASAEDIDWVRRAAPDGAWRSGRLARALARAQLEHQEEPDHHAAMQALEIAARRTARMIQLKDKERNDGGKAIQESEAGDGRKVDVAVQRAAVDSSRDALMAVLQTHLTGGPDSRGVTGHGGPAGAAAVGIRTLEYALEAGVPLPTGVLAAAILQLPQVSAPARKQENTLVTGLLQALGMPRAGEEASSSDDGGVRVAAAEARLSVDGLWGALRPTLLRVLAGNRGDAVATGDIVPSDLPSAAPGSDSVPSGRELGRAARLARACFSSLVVEGRHQEVQEFMQELAGPAAGLQSEGAVDAGDAL